MATSILIIGESGTGKSTSIRNLDPKETCIISLTKKPLPFKGWKNMYSVENKNFYSPSCEDGESKIVSSLITSSLKSISDKRTEIKTIVIDDFQYLMADEFMKRAYESGWGKFTDIAKHAYDVIKFVETLRPDLSVVFLSHSDKDEEGRTKCKTIGKLLDEKICLEGLFTIVLNTIVKDDEYLFLTNRTNGYMAKSPMGMFEEKLIPNDLTLVIKAVDEYANEDVEM